MDELVCDFDGNVLSIHLNTTALRIKKSVNCIAVAISSAQVVRVSEIKDNTCIVNLFVGDEVRNIGISTVPCESGAGVRRLVDARWSE